MKKILILTNSCGGLYNFRKELLKELINQEYKVFVSSPDGEVNEKIENMGCERINTSIDRRGMNVIKDFQLLLKYHKMMKEIKPDIVFTYTIKPNIYGGIVCRKNKIPYITNITGLGSSIKNGGLLSKISIFLYRVALKKSSCVFFQNEENLNFLKSKKVIKNKYKLIPGSGVNLKENSLEEYPQNDNLIKFIFIRKGNERKRN